MGSGSDGFVLVVDAKAGFGIGADRGGGSGLACVGVDQCGARK